MNDTVLADTRYIAFTTRAFSTGIPTVLSGTPVISAYEDASLTQITAGITLGVDHDSVVGLNMITIVASGANGYEDNKDYNLVVTAGTVGGVSVVGEVVGSFSIQKSPVNWANVSNPTTALDLSGTDIQLVDTATTVTGGATASALATVDTNVDSVLTDTAAMQPLVAKIPLSDGSISWNATALGAINAEADTALTDYDPPTRTEATSDKAEIITDLDDIKGTGFVKDTHSLIDIETYVDILDDGTSGNAKIATDIAATLVDTAAMQPLVAKIPLSDGSISWNSTALAAINAEADTAISDASLATATNLATVDTVVDSILVDTAVIGVAGAGLTDLGGMSTGMKAEVLAEVVKLLVTQMTESYSTDGTAPTVAQSLMLIQQALTEFAISGTTITIKKVDGSTTAATITLDDGTSPTSATRAS